MAPPGLTSALNAWSLQGPAILTSVLAAKDAEIARLRCECDTQKSQAVSLRKCVETLQSAVDQLVALCSAQVDELASFDIKLEEQQQQQHHHHHLRRAATVHHPPTSPLSTVLNTADTSDTRNPVTKPDRRVAEQEQQHHHRPRYPPSPNSTREELHSSVEPAAEIQRHFDRHQKEKRRHGALPSPPPLSALQDVDSVMETQDLLGYFDGQDAKAQHGHLARRSASPTPAAEEHVGIRHAEHTLRNHRRRTPSPHSPVEDFYSAADTPDFGPPVPEPDPEFDSPMEQNLHHHHHHHQRRRSPSPTASVKERSNSMAKTRVACADSTGDFGHGRDEVQDGQHQRGSSTATPASMQHSTSTTGSRIVGHPEMTIFQQHSAGATDATSRASEVSAATLVEAFHHIEDISPDAASSGQLTWEEEEEDEVASSADAIAVWDDGLCESTKQEGMERFVVDGQGHARLPILAKAGSEYVDVFEGECVIKEGAFITACEKLPFEIRVTKGPPGCTWSETSFASFEYPDGTCLPFMAICGVKILGEGEGEGLMEGKEGYGTDFVKVVMDEGVFEKVVGEAERMLGAVWPGVEVFKGGVRVDGGVEVSMRLCGGWVWEEGEGREFSGRGEVVGDATVMMGFVDRFGIAEVDFVMHRMQIKDEG